jgi:hypothetical protein
LGPANVGARCKRGVDSDQEEQQEDEDGDEDADPQEESEIDILADMLARQGNRRATTHSDEEYEGW